MQVRIEELRVHRDARGSVCEPLDAAGIAAQSNVHLVFIEPGCVRGNHYHLRATEVMAVYGPALVRLREARSVRDVEVPDGGVVRFTIPPGIAHAVRNTGSAPGLVVSFSSEVHDPAAPDVVRELLIEG